jgi:hypothetical protein
MGKITKLEPYQIQTAKDIIGQRIEEIAKERGRRMTLYEMGQECGLSQSALGLYIKGSGIEGARFYDMLTFLNYLQIPPQKIAQALGLFEEK